MSTSVRGFLRDRALGRLLQGRHQHLRRAGHRALASAIAVGSTRPTAAASFSGSSITACRRASTSISWPTSSVLQLLQPESPGTAVVLLGAELRLQVLRDLQQDPGQRLAVDPGIIRDGSDRSIAGDALTG